MEVLGCRIHRAGKLEIARQYWSKNNASRPAQRKNIVFHDDAILEIIVATRAKPESAISSAKSEMSAAK